MSQEPVTPDLVELTRRLHEAGNRRDFDAMMSFYAQDAVWDMSTMGMGTFSGRAAIRDHFEDWFAPYEAWHSKVEEVRDLGNDIVFTVFAAYAGAARSPTSAASPALPAASATKRRATTRRMPYLFIRLLPLPLQRSCRRGTPPASP